MNASPSTVGRTPQVAPLNQSSSFTAHLKTLERTLPLRSRYGNLIGGKWVEPVKGGYFDNVSPTTGQVICQIPRSQAEDVEKAIDATTRPRTPGVVLPSPTAPVPGP